MLGNGFGTRRLLVSFRFGDCHRRVGFPVRHGARSALQPFPDDLSNRFVNGTGVGFLLGDTELGQHVENRMRWDFELPCQLVDSNFRHSLLQRHARGA
jgi:hypothetical protein